MALIDQVRRKLNVTWHDEDTDSRIMEIVASAEVIMAEKLGISADEHFDFAQAGRENDLFKSYCLYEWNHAANEFDDNYANAIAQCRAKHEVRYHLKQESESDSNAEG